MAKFDWGFQLLNKDTADRDGVVSLYDSQTESKGNFALSSYTGDGKPGDCIFAEAGFREFDATAALKTWGWI